MEDEIVQLVWEKGIIDPKYNSEEIRKDPAGAWIRRDKYNDRNSSFGWEIDHVVPRALLEQHHVSQELIDHIDNLRPMNWKNNVSKGDDYPSYNRSVVAKDDTNVCEKGVKIVNSEVQSRLQNLYAGVL